MKLFLNSVLAMRIGLSVLCVLFLVLFLVLFVGDDVLAQTAQLPSVREFSYRGGVWVPDGGSTFLGGNRSAAMGSSSRGVPLLPNLPGSRFGSRGSSSGVSASVTIIDLDEMDRKILGEDWRDSMKRGTSVVHRVEKEIEEEIEEEIEADIAEAKSLVRNARRAWRAGKVDTARHTYELAIERLTRSAERENQERRAASVAASGRESRVGSGGDSGSVSVNRTDYRDAHYRDAHYRDASGMPEATYLLSYARAEYTRLFPQHVTREAVRP